MVLLEVSSCEKGAFPRNYGLLGGQALGSWKAPRDNFDCNRCYMNKGEFVFEFHFVIVFDLLGWQR